MWAMQGLMFRGAEYPHPLGFHTVFGTTPSHLRSFHDFFPKPSKPLPACMTFL